MSEAQCECATNAGFTTCEHWEIEMGFRSGEDSQRLENQAREAYDVMVNHVCGLECMGSLVNLKRFIQNARNNNRFIFTFRGNKMGFHVFPFILDLIVRYATSPPLVSRPLNEDDIARLIDHYVDFPEMLSFPTGESDLNKYVPEFLVRTSFEQLHMQSGNTTFVPRILYLYREIPQNDLARHDGFVRARDEVLRRQFRVNLDELLLSTFALSAVARNGDRFGTKVDTEIEWMKPIVTSEAFTLVRQQLTLSRNDYRSRASTAQPSSYIHIRTTPKLIADYPIVQIDGFSIAPDPHLLADRVTKRLHDSVYKYFAENDRIHDYAGTFGTVFKDYTGVLLREAFPNAMVLDVDLLGPNDTGKKADWIVMQGSTAIVVECKALHYPKEVKEEGSLAVLESFLDERVGPALDQLDRTAEAAPRIAADKGFADISSVYRVIVLEEHFEFINSLRDFLPSNQTVSRIVGSGTQIYSALDLEILVSCSIAGDVERAVAAKVTAGRRGLSLERHLRTLPGFRFIDDNVLERKFNEFFRKDEP